MPPLAHSSSLSEPPPEMPPAPPTSPSWSRITPPEGAGITRPPLAAESAVKKAGCLGARPASVREPSPMPSAPHAFPKAMSKRRIPDRSSRLNATRCPPASSTATDRGWKLCSRPVLSATSTMVEACASVSEIIWFPRLSDGDDEYRGRRGLSPLAAGRPVDGHGGSIARPPAALVRLLETAGGALDQRQLDAAVLALGRHRTQVLGAGFDQEGGAKDLRTMAAE